MERLLQVCERKLEGGDRWRILDRRMARKGSMEAFAESLTVANRVKGV